METVQTLPPIQSKIKVTTKKVGSVDEYNQVVASRTVNIDRSIGNREDSSNLTQKIESHDKVLAKYQFLVSDLQRKVIEYERLIHEYNIRESSIVNSFNYYNYSNIPPEQLALNLHSMTKKYEEQLHVKDELNGQITQYIERLKIAENEIMKYKQNNTFKQNSDSKIKELENKLIDLPKYRETIKLQEQIISKLQKMLEAQANRNSSIPDLDYTLKYKAEIESYESLLKSQQLESRVRIGELENKVERYEQVLKDNNLL